MTKRIILVLVANPFWTAMNAVLRCVYLQMNLLYYFSGHVEVSTVTFHEKPFKLFPYRTGSTSQ